MYAAGQLGEGSGAVIADPRDPRTERRITGELEVADARLADIESANDEAVTAQVQASPVEVEGAGSGAAGDAADIERAAGQRIGPAAAGLCRERQRRRVVRTAGLAEAAAAEVAHPRDRRRQYVLRLEEADHRTGCVGVDDQEVELRAWRGAGVLDPAHRPEVARAGEIDIVAGLGRAQGARCTRAAAPMGRRRGAEVVPPASVGADPEIVRSRCRESAEHGNRAERLRGEFHPSRSHVGPPSSKWAGPMRTR